MRWKALLAATIAALSLTVAAAAAPITYTLSGESDVMVGSTGLLDVPVTWTFSGDTSNYLSLSSGMYLQLFTASTVSIPGIGTIAITEELTAVNNLLAPLTFVIVNGDLSGGIAFSAPELFSYDGLSSLGPIPVTYIGSAPVTSDHGDFVITGGNLFLTIAAVPEPATIALLGMGLISAGWMRRRRLVKAA